MKLGTDDRKKVIVLAALAAVAGYLVYTNVLSGPAAPTSQSANTPPPAVDSFTPAAGQPSETARGSAPRAPSGRGRSDEFHPVLHSKRPEERVDTSKIDPTLHLDMLAKLQQMELPTGGRNPFKMGAPPPKPEAPKGPEPKIPIKPLETAVKPPPPPPGPPPPPSINLKYYGFSSAPGASAKTAFFLDGDDILIAKEGDTLKRRYRVVRIGVSSVVMEDTDSKHQQTIPLTEEAG